MASFFLIPHTIRSTSTETDTDAAAGLSNLKPH